MSGISSLQKARAEYKVKLPKSLSNGANIKILKGSSTESVKDQKEIKHLFPHTYGMPILHFEKADTSAKHSPVNIGVVLSGGQAPRGHNVIAGLFDGIKSINNKSKLYGYLGGPGGLIDNKFIEVTSEFLADYRNTGGFDIIGSGRTKLEQPKQFDKAAKNCKNSTYMQ